MLIPHLHFDGNCAEAIDTYERAFDAKVDTASIDYVTDGKKIAHACIDIHGTKVFLNDALNFLNNAYGVNCGAHVTLTFNAEHELLACYEILKADNSPAPFYETPYSGLVGNFVDKFGILWGFMLTDE